MARHAAYVGGAQFQGTLYQIDYYPGAIPSPRAGDRVRGEIFRLLRPELLLPRLDEYEECSPERPRPTEYVRRKSMLLLDSGQRTEAWIYLFNRPVTGFRKIASGDFLHQ